MTVAEAEVIRLVDLELVDPTSERTDSPAERFGAPASGTWRVIGRAHGVPIGSADIPIRDGGIHSDGLAGLARAALADQLDAHLAADRMIDGGASSEDREPACHAVARRVARSVVPVSVIIPTVGRLDGLVTCVESVLASGYGPLEVIVAANGPRAEDVRARLDGRWPDVRVVVEARAGTSLARNRGFEEARGELILFVDDDVVVDRSWLVGAVGAFLDDPGIGAVTGPIVPLELATLAQRLIEAYGGFGKGFTPRRFELARPPDDSPLFPFAAGQLGSGANMGFRREALRRVGGFDPALGGGTPARGGEDLSALVETILDGWAVAYEPRMLVRHHHHPSYARLRRVMLGYGLGLGGYLTKNRARASR